MAVRAQTCRNLLMKTISFMQQVENLVKCKPVWESSVDVMNIAHVYIMSLSRTNKRYRKRWQTFTQLMFYEY